MKHEERTESQTTPQTTWRKGRSTGGLLAGLLLVAGCASQESSDDLFDGDGSSSAGHSDGGSSGASDGGRPRADGASGGDSGGGSDASGRAEDSGARDGGRAYDAGASGSVPTAPIAFTPGKDFITDASTGTQANVPASYDSTHKTPTNLFVWLHGCGGGASADIDLISPESQDVMPAVAAAWKKVANGAHQDWIGLAVGGEEGGCWHWGSNTKDVDIVLAAIADIKTHFNINTKGIVLGGYSSGGNLAYYMALRHAELFAGVLTVNTDPFNDASGRAFNTQTDAANAAWKFNVVHLGHNGDSTYPVSTMQANFASMRQVGYSSITVLTADGDHWDNNTDADVATYLLPHLHDGWAAP